MKKKFSEEDLAKAVIDYLQDLRWDVYQEVQFDGSGRCADIAAVQRQLLWIIECKTSLNLTVIEQAARWNGYANFRSIAAPNTGRPFAQQICRHFGIGVFGIKMQYDYDTDGFMSETTEIQRPALYRINTSRYRNKLEPEHKTFAAAGTASGRRWTPFQRTCREVAMAVSEAPGINLSDLIKKISHHYNTASTARACIRHWLERGLVEGVTMQRDGRALRLYPST